MKNKIYVSALFAALFTFMFCEYTNAQTQTADYYNVKSGIGKGLRLWSGSNNYKIHMGNTSVYKYGPVTDYSIKTNMNNNPARGWTWGVLDKVPVAALNTQGNLQIKGWMKIATTKDASGTVGSGGLEIGNGLRIDNNEIITNTNATLYINHDNNGDVMFDGGSLRVDASTNKVGVGISPVGKLDVNAGTGEGLRIRSTHGNTHLPYSNGSSYIGGENIVFRTTGNNTERMRIKSNGNIGIGTTTPDNKLDVNGTIRAKEIKVESNWSDYVFYDDYQVPTLEEEEKHIEANGHLLGFESEQEMEGMIHLGDVSRRQQAKIEEMMLHLIDMKKEITQLKGENEELKKLLKADGE